MPTDCCFVPGESIRFVPPNSRVFREGTENQKRTNRRCRPPPHVLPVKAPGWWHYSCRCDAAVAPPGTSTLPQTPGALPGVGIARRISAALEFGESALRELQRVFEIFCPALVVNRQLFAGLDAIRRVAGQFVPQRRRTVAVAT